MTGLPPLSAELAGWLVALFLVSAVPLIVFSALIERSGPIRLRHWAEKANGRLLTLYGDQKKFEAFRFLLSLLARLGPLALAWAVWELLRAWEIAAAPVLTGASMVLLLGLVEGVNRYLVEHHSEEALRFLTPAVRALVIAAWWPLIVPLSHLVALRDDQEEEDEDEASDDEIEAYLDVGVREGILEPEEEELVRSIVDFGDTQVRSVMTPRVEMISASVEATAEELCARFFDSKHARLPLYRESIDHVVGILHIRDLFEAVNKEAEIDPAKLANSPHFVPETKPLRQLLTEMQALRQQMAIVVDEYGGVAGLVTVEDLLEEIVGDISDEHEVEEEEPIQIGENRWRVAGRTYLEDLEDLFDIDADDMPYETVSGLICGQLGYVPRAGERVESHGLVFTVEDADERRVTLVSVESQETVPQAAAMPEEQTS